MSQIKLQTQRPSPNFAKTKFCSNINASAGFSLLELVIAISIFAIIATMAFTSLTQVQQANHNTQKTMARLQEIQLAIRKFEQDASQMTLRPIRDENGNSQAALKYISQENFYLEFTRTGADASINLNQTNLLRVAYYYKNKKLYRKIWHQLDRPIDAKSESYPILSKLKSIKITFYDDNRQPLSTWLTNNGNTASLPLAIEITMELEDLGRLRRLIEIKDTN